MVRGEKTGIASFYMKRQNPSLPLFVPVSLYLSLKWGPIA